MSAYIWRKLPAPPRVSRQSARGARHSIESVINRAYIKWGPLRSPCLVTLIKSSGFEQKCLLDGVSSIPAFINPARTACLGTAIERRTSFTESYDSDQTLQEQPARSDASTKERPWPIWIWGILSYLDKGPDRGIWTVQLLSTVQVFHFRRAGCQAEVRKSRLSWLSEIVERLLRWFCRYR
jgi:hypothetical protein